MRVIVEEGHGGTFTDRVHVTRAMMLALGVQLHDLIGCEQGMRLHKSVKTVAEPESPRMRDLIDHVDARYASRKRKTLSAVKTALGG